MTTPRPEYPRPQFAREEWLNLNGEWTYAFDFGRSGRERGWFESKGFDQEILVPFSPESSLSGVAHTDFIDAMWYHRTFVVPEAWAERRTLLNFGAVDYMCEVFVDGVVVGRHYGGTSSFSFDISAHVRAGETHHVVVCVEDDLRSGVQPAGKQSSRYGSHGCYYTRTTGIWQTVWLEPVSPLALTSCHILPDLDGSRFVLHPRFVGERRGGRLTAVLLDDGREVDRVSEPATNQTVCLLSPGDPRTWSPEDPFLYDIRLEVSDASGKVVDRVTSYAGMRKVHVEGDRVYLNNKPLYQRLVLDQGFYPDGIWTAPSDEALRRDIELAMKAGFNGARLHQKVFEERFHYWADRLGYLTWAESSSWGMDVNNPLGARNFLSEWQEIVVRDRNHPSIITWSPFNETGRVTDKEQHRRTHIDAYRLTKDLDPTRPVNDTSGYCHVHTDIWTVHNYTQDPTALKEKLAPGEKGVFRNLPDLEPEYGGEPYLVDEFGGIKWVPPNRRAFAQNSWGYGDAPLTLEAFYRRLEGQVDVILGFDHISGFCYTQLTDVEQEENGIYNFDRTEKFDMARIAEIFTKDRPGPGERKE